MPSTCSPLSISALLDSFLSPHLLNKARATIKQANEADLRLQIKLPCLPLRIGNINLLNRPALLNENKDLFPKDEKVLSGRLWHGGIMRRRFDQRCPYFTETRRSTRTGSQGGKGSHSDSVLDPEHTYQPREAQGALAPPVKKET